MSNSKTQPSLPPRPENNKGWVRKSELDIYLDRSLPIPTQVVSNEEFDPMPQTGQQRALEHRLNEIAENSARRFGVSRRQFLRSSYGMAAAFMAMNSVFGNFFQVEAAELFEPAATADTKTKYFIFDVQSHHVDTGRHNDFTLGLRRMGRQVNPELRNKEPEMKDVWLENYIKEMFLDSETDVAVLSGISSDREETNILPPAKMVRTREIVNELTRCRRLVSHGLFAPNLPDNMEQMVKQAEKYKIEAWKGYTGLNFGPGRGPWSADNEKVAYPSLEYARKMKIKNICLHKGLPLFDTEPENWSPKDIVKASKDFPDLNFLVYHSGFKSVQEALPAAQDGFKKSSYVPWVSDLCEWRKKNPHMNNVYMELGSTFGMSVVSSPMLAAHMLGMIIDAYGDERVLWGTDSIWWGSPQWQIEALRRLEMPESLSKQFGWKPLTTEVKRKIFGLNAARIYGVDPAAKRNPVPGDYVDRLQKMYQAAGGWERSNTQYGWVRA